MRSTSYMLAPRSRGVKAPWRFPDEAPTRQGDGQGDTMSFITSKLFWNAATTGFVVAFFWLFSASERLHEAIMRSPTKYPVPPSVVLFTSHNKDYFITPEQSQQAIWFSHWLFPLLALCGGMAWLCQVLRRRYCDD